MRRCVMVSEDRGLGVTSHGVSVTVTDTQPKWLLQATVCVNNTASALHSYRARTIGVAAVELLEESKSTQRCPDDTAAIGEQMVRFVVSRSHSRAYPQDRRHSLWLSTVLICCSLTASARK
jgi:hypothetical protein